MDSFRVRNVEKGAICACCFCDHAAHVGRGAEVKDMQVAHRRMEGRQRNGKTKTSSSRKKGCPSLPSQVNPFISGFSFIQILIFVIFPAAVAASMSRFQLFSAAPPSLSLPGSRSFTALTGRSSTQCSCISYGIHGKIAQQNHISGPGGQQGSRGKVKNVSFSGGGRQCGLHSTADAPGIGQPLWKKGETSSSRRARLAKREKNQQGTSSRSSRTRGKGSGATPNANRGCRKERWRDPGRLKRNHKH